MFSIADGRVKLYQWDLNIRLLVSAPGEVTEAHFSNRFSKKALTVEVKKINGKYYADVPNILLQKAETIIVYAYYTDSNSSYTKVQESFEVTPRPKPDEYVYTETEVKNYDDLEKRVKALEESEDVSDEDIANAVNDYLEENPINVDLTGYVKDDDYATDKKLGLIKTEVYYGLYSANGLLYVYGAKKPNIDDRVQPYQAITPLTLDYAVKKALSDCKLTGDDVWTDEEKAKALELLGGVGKRGGGTTNILYGEYYMGTQNCFVWNNVPQPYTFYQSYDDGRLRVGEPVEERDATTKKYVDDNFINKVSDKNIMYGTDKDGNQVVYVIGEFGTPVVNRVVVSGVNGEVTVGSPTMYNSATPKQYVDNFFAGVGVCAENKAPQYTKDGNIAVGTAKYSYEAVSKGYVDDLVGSVQSILTELHAHAESLIGGEA